MSSGQILDKINISSLFPCSPILLDNLTLRCRLVAGETGAVNCAKSGKRIHKHLGPEQWSRYFADPFIYPTHHSAPYLKLFGAKTLRTNGKRIFCAETGSPLSHYSGHDGKRMKEEAKNQLNLEEMQNLENLAKASDNEPHAWQLASAFAAVMESREFVKQQYGLDSWNPPETVRQHVVVERLEVYFEVLTHIEMDILTDALERVLYIYLKNATKRRNRIEDAHDEVDRNSYVTWAIPQRKVDNDFIGKHEFKFKAYKKQDRLRIELQANFPKFKNPTLWDGTGSPYIPVALDANRTANILELILKFIWGKVIEHFSEELRPNALIPKIRSRLVELKPAKSNHKNAEKVIAHLAIKRAITTADLLAFGWDRNDLKMMAHPKFGFLRKQEMGFSDLLDGIKPEQPKAIRGVYVLVPDWLERTGKPDNAKPLSRIREITQNLLARQSAALDADLLSSGSAAAVPGLTISGTLAKNLETKQLGVK